MIQKVNKTKLTLIIFVSAGISNSKACPPFSYLEHKDFKNQSQRKSKKKDLTGIIGKICFFIFCLSFFFCFFFVFFFKFCCFRRKLPNCLMLEKNEMCRFVASVNITITNLAVLPAL